LLIDLFVALFILDIKLILTNAKVSDNIVPPHIPFGPNMLDKTTNAIGKNIIDLNAHTNVDSLGISIA
jgi:hypothetical protein